MRVVGELAGSKAAPLRDYSLISLKIRYRPTSLQKMSIEGKSSVTRAVMKHFLFVRGEIDKCFFVDAGCL